MFGSPAIQQRQNGKRIECDSHTIKIEMSMKIKFDFHLLVPWIELMCETLCTKLLIPVLICSRKKKSSTELSNICVGHVTKNFAD